MELVTVYILVSLFFTLLLQFTPQQITKRLRWESLKTKNESAIQKLKSLPALPLWTLIMLTWRVTTFLRYVGSLNKVLLLKFWKIRVVVINDYKLGKELFRNPVFCGKNMSDVVLRFSRGPYGIIFSQDDQWKEQRRFAHQQLKEFGFGTKSMETLIKTEVDSLIDSWTSKKGELFSPNKSFYIPILNSIWVLLAGAKASEDENKELSQLVIQVYSNFSKVLKPPEAILLLVKIKFSTVQKIHSWLPIFKGITAFDRSLTDLRSYFQKIILAKRKTLSTISKNNTPSDLVEAYLMEMNNTADPNSQFFGKTGELNLLAMMTDFFVAGGETTASTLAWAMLHLIRNPDIQAKIRDEVDLALGQDGHLSLQDRANCPYTVAFILEVLRFNPNTVVNLPHVTTENTNIGPYFIEKDTIVFLNIYGIQHDPKVWGDPQNFRPSRFLSEDGERVVQKEEMCIFSMGLRRCIGEQVARDSLFLYVSSICRRFVLKPDPRIKNLPPVLETPSVLHIPETFNMIAIDRYTT